MKERLPESRSIKESSRGIGFTLVSASADGTVSSTSGVIRAGNQILRRFLQCFIWKVVVFPTPARVEDQEVNNFNRLVSDVNAPAPQGRQKRPM